MKTNKNDYIDAEACSEAVTRPTMRFVPIKTDDQLDLQSLHRVRGRWVVRRTAVINQMRGMLLERGITIRKGRHYIEESLPGILEDADNMQNGGGPYIPDRPQPDRKSKTPRFWYLPLKITTYTAVEDDFASSKNHRAPV